MVSEVLREPRMPLFRKVSTDFAVEVIDRMAKKRGKASRKTLESTINRGSKSNSKKPLQTVEVIIRKKVLGEAPEEHHFVVADGRKLKNIIELADALETMSEEIFRHHVNEFKNDFSSWVKDVFYDHSLAEDLSRAKNRLETQIAILRRLVKELM